MNPPKYYVNLMRPYAEWDKDYFVQMEERFAQAQAEAVATAIDAHVQHIFAQIRTWSGTEVPVEAVLAQIVKTFKSPDWLTTVETHKTE